ncbi:accessory factor associated with RNA polymerase II [Serendipita sp. 396]|nr:accessory factor associated with RNA polymerase II [Serendipita sp. 396]KAG8787488.1 accessory factor associated with RNA polymerase II [Serendipita sp. 397]KAG8824820.1 accessory factor associated with RNA polymerase II [Serendipita sp. 401]KAG8856976.1 accessory factor associated with RNA polymerase II [Serendipita sp. 411]KAG8874861.1 accessory factor associated with RNA polymerase II [Serendipita sp. 405]KAG9056706.1 accessory factor associated with RNA polymerase II [Serendipita sp. 40
MAETDALLALRNSIGAKHAITFLNDSNQPTSSLAEANALVLPQTDGGPAITLPKSTPTRLRKPGHTETDPLTHPMDFYTLDAVFLAWSLRGAATAEYMKTVRESGIILTNMVAITEKQSVVEWLEGRIDSHPNIVSHGAPSAVTSSPQKKRYVPDTNDVDAVKRIKQKEVELRDRNTVLRGSKQSNFSSVRNLISERMKKLREIQAANAAASSASAPVAARPESRSPSKKSRPVHPIIMISSSPTALITMWNVRQFLQESEFVDPVTAKTRAAEENTTREDVVVIYRKRTHIEPGGRETETLVKYFVVDDIEALSKFGADAWDRVICVLTTGQAWQFRAYKWSEPRELFHRVKGFYVSWANDAPNPKVKDWNVTELKIDPNKRHLDKSTVAQFWKTLDSWIGTTKPNLLT